MKKQPLIFLPVFIDSCSAETSAQLNTGTVKECLEGLTTKLYLGKAQFRFDTLDAFKDISVWETAIEAKDIVPLYDVYEVASDNTEAVKYETGNFVYTTKKEVKKMVAESYLSLCSHRAYKSFEESDYTQIFEATEKGEIMGVWDAGGVKVKGQDMSNFDVAIRERPTNDKPAYSMVTVTYRDFEEFEDYGIITKPVWDPNTLNGIFELSLSISSANATTVIFKATTSCGTDSYVSLESADMELLTAAGANQTIDTLVYDEATSLYTLTGTALVSGTLGTKGVIDKGEVFVQATAVPVVIV